MAETTVVSQATLAFFKEHDLDYDPVLGEQLDVLMEAMRIHASRSVYGSAWRRYGALSNLLSMARKVDRLMEVFWFGSGSVLHKDATDDAFDLINYAAFFIRNARSGNERGRT